jgi:integrase
MTKPPYTIRRSNGLIYRRRFPSDLAGTKCGQFFQVSLKTGDAKLATRRINDWNLPKQFQDQVDLLRLQKLADDGIKMDYARAATESEAVTAVQSVFAPLLKNTEVHLTHSLVPGAVAVDHPLVLNSLKRLFDMDTATAKAHVTGIYADPTALRSVVNQYDELIEDATRPDPLYPSEQDLSLAYRILAEAGLAASSGSTALTAAANAVGRGRYQFVRLYKARLRSDYDMRISDPLFADYMASDNVAAQTKPAETSDSGKPLQLDQLVAEYRAKKAPKWPKGTADDFDYTMKLAAQFFGAKCLLKNINFKDCLAFRDMLTDLPANHSKKPAFKGLDVRAAVTLARKLGLQGRAPQTLKKQLGEICRLFDHAERFQYVAVSPARGLTEDIFDDVDPRNKREALPDSDIQKILNSDAITKITQRGLPIDWSNIGFKDANIFWLLMILITTGMRLAEACQLLETDIQTDENGVIFFSLQPEKKPKKDKTTREEAPLSEEEKKRFKNKSSRRQVPIPPELLDLGLLEWQKTQRARGFKLLLGHFKRNGKGKFSSASIFIARYFASLKLSVSDATAHYLRHTMKERLENGGIDNKTIYDFGGWSMNSSAFNLYGNRSSAERLAKNLADVPAMPSVLAAKLPAGTSLPSSSSG